MITKVIDNFTGNLTRDNIGDMNSGKVKYSSSFGYDAFTNPKQLRWNEAPIRIDPNATVITDLIMDGKERVESGISYVYAIGHTGRLYKIQVNDPTTYNPNYDNPVLLATLAINSPTFTRGASMDFFGTTEQIFIGHDKGVTSIHFDGTTEAFVGILGSWTQTVPRPLKEFIGNLYAGNGNNLAEISASGIVNTYAKLNPAFPTNTQTRDLDQSSDGNYLHSVVTRLALPDLTSTAQDTTLISNSESYIFKWNGVDTTYTAFDSYPSFSLNGNIMFGNYQYVFGYDIAGACVFNPVKKIVTPILSQAPLPNAINSNGNILVWATTEFYNGFLRMVYFIYGALDATFPATSWYKVFAQSAQGTETDVVRVPYTQIVSNFLLGSVTNGYAGGVAGNGKSYFSTLESSTGPTTKYKFYKIINVALGQNPSMSGVYETQNQTSAAVFRNILKSKLKVSEIRVYTQPIVANNSFQIDVIGNDGNPISNASFTFTAGSNMTVGSDVNWYNPAMAPAHSVGIRITNLGSVNWQCDKIEVDLEESGE